LKTNRDIYDYIKDFFPPFFLFFSSFLFFSFCSFLFFFELVWRSAGNVMAKEESGLYMESRIEFPGGWTRLSIRLGKRRRRHQGFWNPFLAGLCSDGLMVYPDRVEKIK
jgi:hypothetical protein